MKDSKEIHLAMIVIAAAFLAVVNLGLWLAAKHGAIPPIGNPVLWTAFAGLNVVSLVWATSLLGLHPLIVALSYVAGGFLAFKGVEGISGINIAEITTAGATYGAFGALAVGNLTTKVRLKFFNKRQVPFIFIIAVLLVFDAVLSSEISNADGAVVLNALVFPFVLAGVVIGLVWSVLNRYGIGCKTEPVHDTIAVESPETENELEEAEELNTLKIQIPAHIEEEEDDAAVSPAMEETDVPEIAEPPVEETVKPSVALEEKEDDFFPLEIDRDDEHTLSREETCAAIETADDADSPDEDFSMDEFDVNLYASVIDEIDSGEDVIIEEPAVSLALDLNETVAAVEESEKSPILEEKQPESKPPAQTESGQKKRAASDDWLSSHMDLLNKLK